jgi:mannose-6-phosphate isomerase-like protein (cupin superfamily)
MISRATAEHYSWGTECDGWHLVRQAERSVIEEQMPPGAAEIQHYHVSARQFFFVLAGTLTIEREPEVVILCTGQGCEIPPPVPHQVRNDGNEGAEFLVVSCPPSHGDRFSA